MASKGRGSTCSPAVVPAYDDFMAAFRVEDVTAMLSGDLATGLNVCVECCDRHADASLLSASTTS